MKRGYICTKCDVKEIFEGERSEYSCSRCGGPMRRDWGEIQFAPHLPPMRGYHPQLGEEAAQKYTTWEDQRKYCEEKLQEFYDAPYRIENLRE